MEAAIFADVDRKVDEGSTRFFTFGVLKGQAGDFSHRIGTDDGVGPTGDGFEHGSEIEVLVGRDVHLIGSDLTGDGDDGGAVTVGIGDAGDEVRRTGPEGSHADASLACQSAVDIGHEGSTLFMTDGDKFNL